MLDNVKAEFRKVLTVRSTYFILLIALILEVLVFWLAKGYKINHDQIQMLTNSHYLQNQTIVAMNLLWLLYAIIVVLLVTHEYRYNTIMYTLASSKSRSRVLIAKFITITAFAVVFGAVFATLAPLLSRLGLAMHHYTLVHQAFNLHSIVWRVLFYIWGTSMVTAIIAFAVRSQVGAFATMFLWSTTIENLLGLWLHNNQAYLPYSALGALTDDMPLSYMSYVKAAVVGLAWVVGGLIIVWTLFVKRDAN